MNRIIYNINRDFNNAYKPTSPNRYTQNILPYSDYMFFSSTHRKFCMINHMLSHKKNLSNFKEMEIMYGILFNHKVMNQKWVIKGKLEKLKNMEVKQHTLTTNRKLQNTSRWKLKHIIPNLKEFHRSKFKVISTPVKQEKSPKKFLRVQTTPKISRKKEIKFTAKINEEQKNNKNKTVMLLLWKGQQNWYTLKPHWHPLPRETET